MSRRLFLVLAGFFGGMIGIGFLTAMIADVTNGSWDPYAILLHTYQHLPIQGKWLVGILIGVPLTLGSILYVLFDLELLPVLPHRQARCHEDRPEGKQNR